MKHRIARIILIVFVIIIACILFFACGLKSTKAESSHTETIEYELYVLDANGFGSNSRLIFYNNYKVKSENIDGKQEYGNGNVVVTYNTTDGTQIFFANNGITIISPKGHRESFTQGYMRRIGDNVQRWRKRIIQTT